MLVLFAATLFTSAALLFSVQPMIAKVILPLLGGTSLVWNTCMVTFQALLLLGYGYSHLSTSRVASVARQAAVHISLLGAGLLFLPIAVDAEAVRAWPADANPVLRLVGLLLLSVGAPFLMISTTGPLLQRWFARTDHPAARDPYFLYGASNLGSMLALLGYPLLIEPRLTVSRQLGAWAVGYGLLIVLTAACALVAWRAAPGRGTDAALAEADVPPVPLARRLRWIGLAFVPSSLMLGVTTYITTDVAVMPLLWVIPLALYLLTFILVFARKPPLRHAWMVRALPMAAAGSAVSIAADATTPMYLLLPLHLVTFFIAAMVAHGELAADRPAARHLTEFYLCMSVGGVLGGIFNALLAPVLFDRVIEYPLALVLACACRPWRGQPEKKGARVERRRDLWLPVAIGVATAVALLVYGALGLPQERIRLTILFALPMVAVISTLERPLRFALALGAVLLASGIYTGPYGDIVLRERSHFTVLRVARHDEMMGLIHGKILHGRQAIDPALKCQARSYYARTGPVGETLTMLESTRAGFGRANIGVIGLGVGELAVYATAGQRWTFYEIDPEVERIARDTRFFTFLSECASREATLDVKLGDGRLVLGKEPDGRFDLIVLDAFSSDAIPVHLLTREALRTYVAKLAPGGVIAFHVSNLVFDLPPVLASLCTDAGLFGVVRSDDDLTEEQGRDGKEASTWVVMAREEASLGVLATQPDRWKRLGASTQRVWTDDFSNPLGVLMLF
jgi:hypothetical protein